MNPEDLAYHFALSSFARVYGVPGITEEMKQFCKEWKTWGVHAPLDSLHDVDTYFKIEFNSWRHKR